MERMFQTIKVYGTIFKAGIEVMIAGGRPSHAGRTGPGQLRGNYVDIHGKGDSLNVS